MRFTFSAILLLGAALTLTSAITVTVSQLQTAMPYSGSLASTYFNNLMTAMQGGSITTCARVSAFIAQIGHECGDLRWMTELASGEQYEGEADLGNIYPGDGPKYKGRGAIQVTGRYNYGQITNYFNHDFINNPTDAALPEWGFKIAVWYWTTHNLNSFADINTQASFDNITLSINGGYNGKADRDSHWATAKKVWGC